MGWLGSLLSASWAAVAAVLAWLLLQSSPARHLQFYDFPFELNASALVGPYAENTRLRDGVERWVEGQMHGSETMAIDGNGTIYGTTREGEVVRIVEDDQGLRRVEVWLPLGGLLLGLAFGPDGRLWVADATRGLFAVDPATRRVTLHATHARSLAGALTPLGFADDVAVASDGRVFFTDACDIPALQRLPTGYEPMSSTSLCFMTGAPSGRLLEYAEGAGEARTLLDGLFFANGVALSADESFLAVAESFRLRVVRYWLRGPKAGTHDVLIDNLPACPDNVRPASQGGFWVAFSTPVAPLAPFLARHRHLRMALAYLGRAAEIELLPRATVLRVSEAGEVLECLHDPDGRQVTGLTSATEHKGRLYLGTLYGDSLPVFRIPSLG